MSDPFKQENYRRDIKDEPFLGRGRARQNELPYL